MALKKKKVGFLILFKSRLKGRFVCGRNFLLKAKYQIDQNKMAHFAFLLKFRTRENKAYDLNVGSENIPVFCLMEDTGMGTCGGGGWTLVMKIDGTEVFILLFKVLLISLQ